jgi:hypothetical protein
MKAALFLLVIALSAFLVPMAVNFVSSFAMPVLKNFRAIFAPMKFGILSGGGGDELDPLDHPA